MGLYLIDKDAFASGVSFPHTDENIRQESNHDSEYDKQPHGSGREQIHVNPF